MRSRGWAARRLTSLNVPSLGGCLGSSVRRSSDRGSAGRLVQGHRPVRRTFGLAYHSGPLLEDVLLSVLGLAGFVLVPFLGDLA